MKVKIYWKDGSVSTWTTTYMSFSEGYLLEYAHVATDEVETLGVRVLRGFHSSEPGQDACLICDEKIIVSPDEVAGVLALSLDGSFKLMYDPASGALKDVMSAQIMAIINKTDEEKDVDADEHAEPAENEDAFDAGEETA